MSATQAATCSAVGGSSWRWRSCSRTEPMSIERDAVGRVGAEHQLGGAAADVDHQHRVVGRDREVAHRPVERQRRLLVAAQHLGPHPQPRVHAVGEHLGVGGVAGRRGRAEADPLHAVLARSARRTRRWRRRSARSASLVEPAGAVDALAEPHDPRLADRDLGQVADQQLDRVGAAVDGRDASSCDAGPLAHHSPSSSSTSSPSGFTPRPGASAWPASTCRHLTRSGMPPAEMPSISGTSPSGRAEGEVALVGRAVRRGEVGVLGEPVLHLLHQARALERADQRGRAGAGEVEGRRERRAVGQPRLGGDHVGVAARAAVADGVDGPRRPAELRRDGRLVGGVDHWPVAAPFEPSISSAAAAPARAGCRPASPTPTRRRRPRRWVCCATVAGSASSVVRLERVAVLVEHDVRRLAGHHVAEPLAGLLPDVGLVLPARLLALELVDAGLAARRSAP